MSIIDFTKNFYPQNAEGYKRKKNAADSDSSDEDDRMKQLENLPEKLSNLKNIDILLNTHSDPVIADGLSSSLSLNTQSRIFKQKMDPYQLTASIGILNGWTETFCFVCSIIGFEAQFDNIIVTQTPIDCSVYVTILPFTRQIYEF